MGRPRGSTKKADATRELDPKSKTIDKPARATRDKPRKSYRETEGSDSELEFVDKPSSPEEIPAASDDSDEDFDADSSGSEYGKKKKPIAKARGSAKKASPKKATGGKGRGRPPAKGKAAAAKPSPAKRGRKPAAAAKSSTNGSRKKRAAESSDEEVDEKGQTSEEEEEMSDGGSDSEFDKDSDSGSEYGKKAKKAPKMKRESPSRQQPRRTAAPPGKRGRKPGSAATNGSNKKPKLDEDVAEKSASDDEDAPMKIDEGDDEEVDGSKLTKEEKKAEDASNDKKDKSDSEEEVSEEEEKEVEKPKKAEDGLKNRTDTDLSKIDFSCDKKTKSGDAWNFKIACWNIGGIKSWVKKNGLDYVKSEDPDIFCLQEIKCTDKTKPAEVEKIENYPHAYWTYAEQAGHHGVATFSKTEPVSVSYGLPIGDDDSDEDKKLKEMFNKEGRLIVTEFEKFYLLNAYVPNSGRGVKDDNHTKPYPPRILNGERPGWDRLFTAYVKSLDEKKPVIVTGDLNVAHEEIDLANPKTNTSTAGFTKEERDSFGNFLKETKLFDSFRSLYPEAKGAYTFWSFMHNSRAKNVGWRLDYFLLSEKLKDNVCENVIRSEVYGSDHCPIVLFTHF